MPEKMERAIMILKAIFGERVLTPVGPCDEEYKIGHNKWQLDGQELDTCF
jgi:hypothetical protein